MIIRAASADDLPALHDLVERAYRGDSARRGWTHEADLLGGQRTDVAALAETLDDPAQRLLVADDDGAPIGTVTVAFGQPLAHLGMLAVDPERQANGVGRQLVAEAERLAREHGASAIEMTVIGLRTELRAWYERLGYARTGEVRAFPATNPRFGEPKRDDLNFVVLRRGL